MERLEFDLGSGHVFSVSFREISVTPQGIIIAARIEEGQLTSSMRNRVYYSQIAIKLFFLTPYLRGLIEKLFPFIAHV